MWQALDTDASCTLYREWEKFMSRVHEVWAGNPLPGVSEDDARTRLGEIKKLVLSMGASDVLFLEGWMGNNDDEYIMVITHANAAAFGTSHSKNELHFQGNLFRNRHLILSTS